MSSVLRVALVAGEASGDILGSGLMRAIKARHPQVEFIGVGGPLMEAEGMASYFPMERLSVMGLVEVLGRLRELLAKRKALIQTLIDQKPDVLLVSMRRISPSISSFNCAAPASRRCTTSARRCGHGVRSASSRFAKAAI